MASGRLIRLASVFACIVLLLAPALWNGFPLLEYDTGGYLARWYEGTLEVSRSTVYGLFLALLARPDFWPAVIVQSALTVWVIALILRAQGLGGRPLVLLGMVAALTITTTLPWITGILLTDIFAGLGILALYLIVLRADVLAAWERIALIVLVAFSAASHSATLAVLIGLLLVALIAFLVRRPLVPRAGLVRGAAALVLSAVMLVAANYAVVGRLAWTPGGIALSFGRMLQDGIVARFLAEHCPDPRFRLCDHRAEIPTDADEFFWGETIFDQLGRFEGLNDEMRTIVLESIKAYPLWQFGAALSASARQLVKVATGEGVVVDIWHTSGMIENFVPSALPVMRAARQQNGELDFKALNKLHVPVALVSMVLLFGLIALALFREACRERGALPLPGGERVGVRGDESIERSGPPYPTASGGRPLPPGERSSLRHAWCSSPKSDLIAKLIPLAITVALAILGNAVVCGVFANPHDRYGARIVWLATFVVLIALVSLARWQRQRVDD